MLDKADQLIRTAYFDEEGEEDKEFAMDYIWYMWCGPEAPLFDKDKMATFERYFVEDKELHKEKKGYYYTLRNREDVCDQILAEFGASGPHSHIINGHVPVKTIQGEQPMKANGKLFVMMADSQKLISRKRELRDIRLFIILTVCSLCSTSRSSLVRKP